MGSSRHRPSISGGPPSRPSRSRSWHQAALSRACMESCSSSARPVRTSVQAAIRGRSSGNSATGQSRAVLSEPVSTALPSGLYATALDRALVRQGRPDGPPRRRVPEPRRLVMAAGEYGLAVGAVRHGNDPALVKQGRPDRLARRRVPEPRRLVRLPVSTALPSGLNATALTSPWCARGGPMGRPVAVSQSRAVLSALPVSTALPSGLNATAVTAPWCARGGPMGGPSPRPRAAPSGHSCR